MSEEKEVKFELPTLEEAIAYNKLISERDEIEDILSDMPEDRVLDRAGFEARRDSLNSELWRLWESLIEE